MAGPTLVGTNKIAGSSATSSVAGILPSSVTAGSTIMVAVSCDSDTVPSATAVSDGVNTYTRIVSQAGVLSGGSPTGSTAIYKATNVASGSTTVTFNNSANSPANFVGISVAEVTADNGTLDGTSGNNASATGTPNPGSITTTNANDSVFVSAVNSINDTVWTIGSGYTLLATVTSAANTTIGFQYISLSATASPQATAFGNSSTGGWAAAAVVIEASGGAAVPNWQSLAELPDFNFPPLKMIAY